jgi:hypothetical protein
LDGRWRPRATRPSRRVLAGALAVMCPFGQPDRLAKPLSGSHNRHQGQRKDWELSVART